MSGWIAPALRFLPSQEIIAATSRYFCTEAFLWCTVPPQPPPPPPGYTVHNSTGTVTVFCPSDDAVKAFMPRYRNLTADGKASLLLFHAVPVHYSLGGLKSNNGPMNTLATDGAARNYNFTLQNEGDVVTIETAASKGGPARVKSTVLDKDPIAVYAIDTVVEPVELFKPAPSPAPAPAADAPKAGKAARHPAPTVVDAPGPSASDEAPPEDQKKGARKSAGAGAPCVRWLAVALAAVAAAFTWV